MKLATLKEGGRDGTLIVVSGDLSKAVRANSVAPTLQVAVQNWHETAPQLEQIYDRLNEANAEDAFELSMDALASPLPRAYQWADGSAYVNHVELVRKARNAEMPASFYEDPLMYQGGSDSFIGPREDIEMEDEAWGIDFESEIAVITDDVPMGVSADLAGSHIKLLMLVNDVSLRNLIPAELGKGFGFFQSKPSSAFSPVAVTRDELGSAWLEGKLHLPLLSSLNGKLFGKPQAGVDMTFSFPKLISHAAKTRPLGAGTIIGSGTVSNKQDTSHGSAIEDGGVGYSCIAELRMYETISKGKPVTPFMQFGDTVRIEMLDADGMSVFGAIDQKVVRYRG
ncbi:MAG: fumarylacetoacetate hydrolase family protein [Rhodospirillales bacterium]